MAIQREARAPVDSFTIGAAGAAVPHIGCLYFKKCYFPSILHQTSILKPGKSMCVGKGGADLSLKGGCGKLFSLTGPLGHDIAILVGK